MCQEKNMETKIKIGPKLEKPLRLSEQVATRLVSKIKEGAFQPGEKLPSEAVLAEQFGVSRTVIREALARLKYDGLLDSHPGIGATVVENGKKRTFRLDDFDQLSTEDIEHLFELRAILEGDAAFLAASRRSLDHVERLNKCIRQMAEAICNDHDGTAPDANFHSIIAEASLNPYLNELMQLLNDKVVNLIRKARGHTNQNPNLLPRKVQKEHKAIYRAIADKNPVEARTAVLTHIKNAGDRLGVKVETTI
jgi:DNA-binding FadR family transcriptional regulator